MAADTVHDHQCAILSSTVECIFCRNPVRSVREGFVNKCGHGMHATCAAFCEMYGMDGCISCSPNSVVRAAKIYMVEYARRCYAAVQAGEERPCASENMLQFFAHAGDVSELVYMHGTIYSNGLGVPQDDVKAYKLMSRAAALGNASALYAVSGHHEGKIRLAANRGCFNACCELAELTSDEKWLVKALDVSAFDAGVRFALASRYEASSPKEAMVHYYMLARQGNKAAKERLARMFYDMAADDKTHLIASMFWACKVTTPKTMKVRALVSLQLDYYDKAFECMSLAATSPCEIGIDAMYELSRFHVLGTGTPVDEKKAQELLEQAAEKGQASAQFDLAMIRLEEDRPMAMKLVREAAKTHVVAMHFLSKYEPDRSLLEKAGTMIPLALYDLAVRHVMDAEKGDTEENYKKAVELLKRAEAMPDPLFDCDVLDREEAASLLSKLERRLVVCEKLHCASMDSILRLAQYNKATLLADVVEKKLKN